MSLPSRLFAFGLVSLCTAGVSTADNMRDKPTPVSLPITQATVHRPKLVFRCGMSAEEQVPRLVGTEKGAWAWSLYLPPGVTVVESPPGNADADSLARTFARSYAESIAQPLGQLQCSPLRPWPLAPKELRFKSSQSLTILAAGPSATTMLNRRASVNRLLREGDLLDLDVVIWKTNLACFANESWYPLACVPLGPLPAGTYKLLVSWRIETAPDLIGLDDSPPEQVLQQSCGFRVSDR